MWNLQENIRCIVHTILQSFPRYQPNCRFAPLKSEREAEKRQRRFTTAGKEIIIYFSIY